MDRNILTAEVVYNGLGTPRAGGAVTVQGRGDAARIVSVDDLAAARQKFPNTPERFLGFALSPPPVNAHTHLDLSTMPYTPGPYEKFIAGVVAHGKAGERGVDAARLGLAQLRAHGTRVTGDIVTGADVMHLLLASELTGVAYWEVTGPDPAEADAIFRETVEQLRGFRALERPGGMRVGVSPHTPHTVSAPLLQKLAALAQSSGLPLQIHVAETAGELELHATGTGALAEFMRPLLPDWRPSGLSPVGYLKRLGVLAARPTLVHMVHVTEEDVRAVQSAGCAVVHCPRSNRALGCGTFPWELYAKHGVSVAFGTDSPGSSPDLNVQSEAVSARAHRGMSDLALVRAAVKGGYRALGMEPPRVLKGDPLSKLQVWSTQGEPATPYPTTR